MDLSSTLKFADSLTTDVASVAARGRIGQVKSEELRGWAGEERRNDICSSVNAFESVTR